MRRALAWACAALALATGPAAAQFGGLTQLGGKQPVSRDQPVTFTADQVEYDRDSGIVSASGHVEAWQNDNVLRADKVTFDRNTNVAAATGDVVLLQPDGQVLFADYAELSAGLKDGILRGMRAQLAENGKLAANGARRTNGLINELSKVVYSTCNICKDDPSQPPFWQMRASSAVEDKEHERIEFTDATLEMFGYPVAYFPYFSNADPSAKRQSGFLIPSVGNSSFLGTFLSVPYYLVLDDQSDVTITPTITSRDGPQLDLDYRRRFNDGALSLNGSIGYLNSGEYGSTNTLQGSVFAKGRFDYDANWRYGFDVDRASSVNYLEAFSLGRYLGSTPSVLTSSAFIEGFGQGAYAKLDSRVYQSLTTSLSDTALPVVLPRFEYGYFGALDSLGGRLSMDAGAFNVFRSVGVNTRRSSLSGSWVRPFTGELGDQWTVTLHGDAAAYDFDKLGQQPVFGAPTGSGDVAHALPQAAVMVRWPFVRDSGAWGQQILEPIVQGVLAPNSGDSQFTRIPNEDSVDLEFNDSDLFSLNRFPGVDRLEGGSRVDAALHAAWYLNGTALDGLVGQSYQTEVLRDLPPKSGLNHNVSDLVGHASFTPTDWFDVTYRTRLDKSTYQIRLADAVATLGGPKLNFGFGYLRTSTNPYTLLSSPDSLFFSPQSPANAAVYFPRDEGTLSVNSKLGDYRVGGYARRDLAANQMIAVGGTAAYENECYIFDVIFSKLYTSINNQTGSTSVLFQMTFKSVGQFGFHAF